MIAAERQDLILKKIRVTRVVSVGELAKEFNTTEITIRRDLDFLEKQGWLTRSYGGAMLNEKVAFESDFSSKEAKNPDIKSRIAQKAASLITEGECIGIDIGTTAFGISHYIRDIPGLKVITASVPVVMELASAPAVKVVCVGGELSRKDISLTGQNAIRTLQEYILDRAFIGVAGASFKYGYTLYNYEDALVKRVLLERAREVVIVTDSSKIGLERHAFMANIDAAHKLITDSGISEEDKKRFESYGVEVILADLPPETEPEK